MPDIFKGKLGKIHNLMFDFMRWTELPGIGKEFRHSNLIQYIEKPDAKGNVPEVWLWWETLNSEPHVQKGRNGPISVMFQERFWKGVVVRLNGNGLNKQVLIPRGHLKSTICNEAHTLWEIIREPGLRHCVRCQNTGLSRSFLANVKYYFDSSKKFQRLFGFLRPGEREAIWNADAIQVLTDDRRGREPTIMTFGLKSEMVGFHYDRMKLDDVVTNKNSETREQREKVRDAVQRLEFIRDPHCPLIDIGTVYAEDDSHSLFNRPEGGYYDSSSFICATVLDNTNQPLWPEVFSIDVIQEKRNKCQDDYAWFTQYYNQPYASRETGFEEGWWSEGVYSPEKLAVEEKLDIFIAVDPANSKNKNSDFSAGIVVGQSERNPAKRYILDGFRDKLAPHEIGPVLADLIEKWQGIASLARTRFRFAIESYGFQQYILFPLRDTLRQRGCHCNIEELSPKHTAKTDRIKRLQSPFSTGSILCPKGITKKSADGKRTYDFVGELKHEFQKFPRAAHDDVLDALAYIEEMIRPTEIKVEIKTEATIDKSRSAYSRDREMPEEREARESQPRQGRWFPKSRDTYSRNTQDNRRPTYAAILMGRR